MIKNEFANTANSDLSRARRSKNMLLSRALDCLGEILGIEFGSLTIHFHKGKWSPRIEIKKTVIQDVE